MNPKLVVGGLVVLGLVVALQLVRRTDPAGRNFRKRRGSGSSPPRWLRTTIRAQRPTNRPRARRRRRRAPRRWAASRNPSGHRCRARRPQPRWRICSATGSNRCLPKCSRWSKRSASKASTQRGPTAPRRTSSAGSHSAPGSSSSTCKSNAGPRCAACKWRNPHPQADSLPLPDFLRSLDLQPRFLMSIVDSYGNLKSGRVPAAGDSGRYAAL